MTWKSTSRACSLLLLCLLAACRDDPARRAPVELQRGISGDVEVRLLAPTSTLLQTRNYCTLEFRTLGDHQLVDVGTVTVRTTMMMEGGETMDGFVTVPTPVSRGRYEVQMVLAMSGSWTIIIAWDGARARGSVTFPALVGLPQGPSGRPS